MKHNIFFSNTQKAWAADWPTQSPPFAPILRLSIDLGGTEPPPAAASLNPSFILSLPFSLIRAECSQQSRMASRGGSGGGGAAAAPLAGARVRLEPRAAPSRRATVVPFADRARAVAWHGRLPARRRGPTTRSAQVGPLFVLTFSGIWGF